MNILTPAACIPLPLTNFVWPHPCPSQPGSGDPYAAVEVTGTVSDPAVGTVGTGDVSGKRSESDPSHESDDMGGNGAMNTSMLASAFRVGVLTSCVSGVGLVKAQPSNCVQRVMEYAEEERAISAVSVEVKGKPIIYKVTVMSTAEGIRLYSVYRASQDGQPMLIRRFSEVVRGLFTSDHYHSVAIAPIAGGDRLYIGILDYWGCVSSLFPP